MSRVTAPASPTAAADHDLTSTTGRGATGLDRERLVVSSAPIFVPGDQSESEDGAAGEDEGEGEASVGLPGPEEAAWEVGGSATCEGAGGRQSLREAFRTEGAGEGAGVDADTDETEVLEGGSILELDQSVLWTGAVDDRQDPTELAGRGEDVDDSKVLKSESNLEIIWRELPTQDEERDLRPAAGLGVSSDGSADRRQLTEMADQFHGSHGLEPNTPSNRIRNQAEFLPRMADDEEEGEEAEEAECEDLFQPNTGEESRSARAFPAALGEASGEHSGDDGDSNSPEDISRLEDLLPSFEARGGASQLLTTASAEESESDGEASDNDDEGSRALPDEPQSKQHNQNSDTVASDSRRRRRHPSALSHTNTETKWYQTLMTRIWVSDDLQFIYSPALKMMVPLPPSLFPRKKAVIELFLHLVKPVWFIKLSGDANWINPTITKHLWFDVFTQAESEQLLHTTFEKMHYDLVIRAIAITEEWGLKYNFPAVPETETQSRGARGVDQIAARAGMKIAFLNEASEATVDRWVKFLFGNIIQRGNLHRLLHSGPDDRYLVMEKMMTVTDFPYRDQIQWSFEKQFEMRRSGAEKFNDVMDQHLGGLFSDLSLNDK
ncbi:hypothetical protein B2J93_5838 [Marssonina coronariae]|uniref:Uncharacterized protein n=1 Tax=Diplocarpon coronariae TaxID=2795749 RepID=A0A218YV53_9HELO|nr:hypothetical protein B2J93_5838 [Marssonina coronariae]